MRTKAIPAAAAALVLVLLTAACASDTQALGSDEGPTAPPATAGTAPATPAGGAVTRATGAAAATVSVTRATNATSATVSATSAAPTLATATATMSTAGPSQRSGSGAPAVRTDGGPMFGSEVTDTEESPSTCSAEEAMAGVAGGPGTSLATCEGWVGISPTPVLTVSVGQTVYVQVDDQTRLDAAAPSQEPVTLSVTPAGSATLQGWTIRPSRAGTVTVHQRGIPCQPTGEVQPATCVLFDIDVTG